MCVCVCVCESVFGSQVSSLEPAFKKCAGFAVFSDCYITEERHLQRTRTHARTQPATEPHTRTPTHQYICMHACLPPPPLSLSGSLSLSLALSLSLYLCLTGNPFEDAERVVPGIECLRVADGVCWHHWHPCKFVTQVRDTIQYSY